MELLMSHGLALLEETFTTDVDYSTALILSTRTEIGDYPSEALQVRRRMDEETIETLLAQMKTSSLKIFGDNMQDSRVGWPWDHD